MIITTNCASGINIQIRLVSPGTKNIAFQRNLGHRPTILLSHLSYHSKGPKISLSHLSYRDQGPKISLSNFQGPEVVECERGVEREQTQLLLVHQGLYIPKVHQGPSRSQLFGKKLKQKLFSVAWLRQHLSFECQRC